MSESNQTVNFDETMKLIEDTLKLLHEAMEIHKHDKIMMFKYSDLLTKYEILLGLRK